MCLTQQHLLTDDHSHKPIFNGKETYLDGFGKYKINRKRKILIKLLEYNYNTIVYPIPFNQLYNNISFRYVNFGLPNPQLPSFVITGAIPQYNNQYSDYLVTTASSDNHGYSSFNLLYSVLLFDPYASIVYVDLGLSSNSYIYWMHIFILFIRFKQKWNRMVLLLIESLIGTLFLNGWIWHIIDFKEEDIPGKQFQWLMLSLNGNEYSVG